MDRQAAEQMDRQTTVILQDPPQDWGPKGVSKLITNPIRAMEKWNMKKCKVLSLKTRK